MPIQIIINSSVAGLLLSLVAIGFSYIFRVTKVFHLAHSSIYISSAFICWWVLTNTNNWLTAVGIAQITAISIIYISEKLVYLPLNRKVSNENISLITSVGLMVILNNIIALVFGNQVKTYTNFSDDAIEIGNIILTKIQLIQSLSSLVIITAFFLIIRVTKYNLLLQAVSDNEIASKVLGINVENARVIAFIAGSILACFAAILKTVEVGVDLRLGLGITLTASVVAIVIPRLDIFLITIASIAISLLQNIVEWYISTQWKEGFTFFLLLIVILFRTEGIISFNLRKDRV